MSKRAIYAGTFDPVTFGHIDLIKRASRIFSEVIIAVAHNPQKEPLFNVRKKRTNILIRGLRMISDFEYEFQMALTNRKLAPDIETIFLMPQESYSYLSSKLLKEAVSLGGDISCFVPDFVCQALKDRLRRK